MSKLLTTSSLAAAMLLCLSHSASAQLRTERSLSSTHPDWPVAELSPDQRAERATRIRDAAAQVGMHNAVLLAGIGQVETGFAHCWSEATWACQGPPSSSCDGGPVIAGAADGPCSLEQGGLGMFQFDSGTFSQTIATYGADIVTIEGNVGAVVPFLVTRAIQSIDGVTNEQEALDWMNSIPIDANDPLFQQWIYFVSWRYNGCQGCSAQEGKYRDGTLLLQDEMGPDFWANGAEDLCTTIPAAGRTIEEDDLCYRARGPQQFWRDVPSGHGGALQWTMTTDNAEPSNSGVWRLRFEEAGSYEVKVFSDGGEFGMSKQAPYVVSYAGGSETVTVDQSGTAGWISLGVFDFDTGDGYQVRLDDNTGEALVDGADGTKLMFDALRVAPPGSEEPDPGNPDPEPDPEMDGGNVVGLCAISQSGPTGAWPLLFALFLIRRRKFLRA